MILRHTGLENRDDTFIKENEIMTTIDLTAIILALITMISGWVTYWFDRRKHKAEVQNLETQAKNMEADAKKVEAETKKEYMDLAKMYVDEFMKNIVSPLQNQVDGLIKRVNELEDELDNVKKSACYRGNCGKRICVLQ